MNVGFSAMDHGYYYTGPFPYYVIDNWLPLDVAAFAAREWPTADCPDWLLYNGRFETGKLTCNDWTKFPKHIHESLRRMLGIQPGFTGDPELPDVNLYGAGMHAMGRGSKLDVHLDADRHPQNGLQRHCNAILFLNETWEPEWGGALEFWSARMESCVVRIEPRFNRLVVFQTSDVSYHGIPEPLKCPPGVLRKSLAVYFWRDTPGEAKRPRARYVARPQDDHDEEAELARLRRAGL